MQDCTYKYVKKKKAKKRFKTKFKIFLAIFCILIFGLIFYYFKVVSPIVCSLSEEKVRSLSTQVISRSVSLALYENGITYDELISISYNNNNEISLIQTNTVEVNKLVRRVTELVQLEMDGLGQEGIQIALGTFTGIPFLFGLGPLVSLKLVPIGTVNTKFNSQFQSAGINQTKHSLYFEISANIGMILPARTHNFVTSLDVAIAESIIVGKIPEIYLRP